MIYLFIVETNSKTESDDKYIRTLLMSRYDYDGDKLKFIHMKGNGNYESTEKSVKDAIKKYQGKGNIVFFCIDLDQEHRNKQQLDDNEKRTEYASRKGYELIWFKEDIEQVFLGKSVQNNAKKKEADRFLLKSDFKVFDSHNTNVEERTSNMPQICSNISRVLDSYFKKKK